jgi:hypothetical protein
MEGREFERPPHGVSIPEPELSSGAYLVIAEPSFQGIIPA